MLSHPLRRIVSSWCIRVPRQYVSHSWSLLSPPRALPHYKLGRKDFDDAVKEQSRFPWKDEFELGRDLVVSSEDIIQTLEPLMTDERVQRIKDVAARRTFDCLPIMEHPYDLGNVAAVCRSADALGLGAVHIIRNSKDEKYKQSTRTSGGAEKWLDVQLFDSTEECIRRAKMLGYQIVVAHLHGNSIPPGKIDWQRPTAIVLGNELSGPSPELLKMADKYVSIPMDGFVESFNVSVAAALILWEARRVRIEKLGVHGDLSEEEQRILLAVLYLRGKGMSMQMASELLQRAPPEWQMFRGNAKWDGKTFTGISKEDINALRHSKCLLWDGEYCWGEKLGIFHGHCRHQDKHVAGVSTLNTEKLKQMCERRGIPMPDVINSCTAK